MMYHHLRCCNKTVNTDRAFCANCDRPWEWCAMGRGFIHYTCVLSTYRLRNWMPCGRVGWKALLQEPTPSQRRPCAGEPAQGWSHGQLVSCEACSNARRLHLTHHEAPHLHLWNSEGLVMHQVQSYPPPPHPVSMWPYCKCLIVAVGRVLRYSSYVCGNDRDLPIIYHQQCYNRCPF